MRDGREQKALQDKPGLCVGGGLSRCAGGSASPQELYIALLSEPYTNGTLIPHSDKGRGSSGHRSWPRPLCDCVPLFHSLRAGAHGTESSYHLKLHRLISNHPWGLPGVSVWPVWAPLPLREAFYSLHVPVL